MPCYCILSVAPQRCKDGWLGWEADPAILRCYPVRYPDTLPRTDAAARLGENEMGASDIVCPFYAKGDKYCDVGDEYISPHDVNLIIRYCSCRYTDCLKYRELCDRFPEEAQELAAHAG